MVICAGDKEGRVGKHAKRENQENGREKTKKKKKSINGLVFDFGADIILSCVGGGKTNQSRHVCGVLSAIPTFLSVWMNALSSSSPMPHFSSQTTIPPREQRRKKRKENLGLVLFYSANARSKVKDKDFFLGFFFSILFSNPSEDKTSPHLSFCPILALGKEADR